MEKFIQNERYLALLLKNAEMTREHKINTPEYRILSKELTDIERAMSAKDIIRHAEICFPHVQEI